MQEETLLHSYTENEIQHIRNESLPRIHIRLDKIDETIGKILDMMSKVSTWQAVTDTKVTPLSELLAKTVKIEGQLSIISRLCWGVGSILLAGIIGLGSWLFQSIVGRH